MQRKIETILVIILAVCAVLLLRHAASGTGPLPTDTTAPAGQTTEPATQPGTEPDTVPATEPKLDADIRAQVEQILDRADLVQTAVTRRVSGSDRTAEADTRGQWQTSHGCALADLMRTRAANPVSAFWELVSAGIYGKQADSSGVLAAEALRVPAQEQKRYDNTAEGARQLLTDLLTLAAGMEDGLDLEADLLGADGDVEAGQVFYSESDGCRYAYFSCTWDRATCFLCFYLRGDAEIRDVELQLLYLRHATGDADALDALDRHACQQTASLMTAAELLMTGSTRAGEGQIPFTYTVGGAEASLARFTFHSDPDRGSLTNYRLRTEG